MFHGQNPRLPQVVWKKPRASDDPHCQVREEVSQQVEAARRELVAENRVWGPRAANQRLGGYLTRSSCEL